MHEIATLLERHHGVLTHRTALARGIGQPRLSTLVTEGRLIRAGRGAFVGGELFRAATPEERHTLRARAIAASLPGQVALSHRSAACAVGLPWIGEPPARVHLVRHQGGEYRRAAQYTLHRSFRRQEIVALRGMQLLKPAWALLGVAEQDGFEQTVACADAALHRGLVTMQELERVAELCRRRPGAPVLRAALAVVDATAESVGESRSRLLLRDLGYAVRTQVPITDARGQVVARVDFLIEGTTVIVEFDGMVKYARGDGVADPRALAREKVREDRLRSLGYEVVRLTWRDLDHPMRVDELIVAALRRASRRG